MLLTLGLIDLSFRAVFPHFSRLPDGFSAAYLARELRSLEGGRPIVVLGDSVLWGYGISAEQTAAARLHWKNLAYEGGSPANIYAMALLLLAQGIHPRAVVFNVNLKTFNPLDSAYARLHPSAARLVTPLLSAGDRTLLSLDAAGSFESRLNDLVERYWLLYAMRNDVRSTLFGAPDAAHALDALRAVLSGASERKRQAHRLRPDRFEGTYALGTLDSSNVSLHFLIEAVALLRRARIPCAAVFTPTNHALLHEYIDVPEYGAQLTALRRALGPRGARILDYDREFTASEFIDNDHLTPAGNSHLARLLRSVAIP